MKAVILFLFIGMFNSVALSNDNSKISTDMKLLCEINRIEKALSKDKNIDKADLAERIHSLKEAALRDQSSKDALKAIAGMDPNETSKAWKNFAKENGVKKVDCL